MIWGFVILYFYLFLKKMFETFHHKRPRGDWLQPFSPLSFRSPHASTLGYSDTTPAAVISHLRAFPNSSPFFDCPSTPQHVRPHSLAYTPRLQHSSPHLAAALFSASSAGPCPPEDTSLSPQRTASECPAHERSSAHVYRGSNSGTGCSHFSSTDCGPGATLIL